jgi:hypothetical protein
MGLNIVHPDGKVRIFLLGLDQIAYRISGRQQKQSLI